MTQCKDDTQRLSTERSAGSVQRARSGFRVATTTRVSGVGTALERSARNATPKATLEPVTLRLTGRVAGHQWREPAPPIRRSSEREIERRRANGNGRLSERPGTCSTSPFRAAKYFARGAAQIADKKDLSRPTTPITRDRSRLTGSAQSVTARGIGKLSSVAWVWCLSFRRVSSVDGAERVGGRP